MNKPFAQCLKAQQSGARAPRRHAAVAVFEGMPATTAGSSPKRPALAAMRTVLAAMRTVLAAASVLTMLPATAAQFDFYKLKSPPGGSDFLPSGPSFNCTSGDKCSSNVDGGVFGGVLTYTNAGVSLAASGSFNGGIASVVQDNEDGWSATKGAGLGVYHLKGVNSDDNITTGEKLTITFGQSVALTQIDLRSEGHNFTSWGSGKTFLLNGVSNLLPQGLGYIPVNMTGTVFTFEFGGANADQFYLAAMTAQPVPEPGAYALMAAGLGVVGFVVRRRSAA